MRHRGSWRQGVALAALALALSACGLGESSEDGGSDGNGRNGGNGGSAAGSGSGDGQPQRQPPGSAPPSPAKVLASRDGSSGEVPVRVEVNDLFRRGQLVTVNFSVTYRTPDDDKEYDSWRVDNAFDDGNSLNGVYTVDAVYLIDGKSGTRHPVARDGEDQCVCSAGLGGKTIDPGQSLALTATFAAPPSDVQAVDVQIPLAGTFSDVPIR